jgi:hypothetical protein
MKNSDPLCKHCRRPIRDGQPRWSGRDPEDSWHYDCATRAGLTIESKKVPSTT